MNVPLEKPSQLGGLGGSEDTVKLPIEKGRKEHVLVKLSLQTRHCAGAPAGRLLY